MAADWGKPFDTAYQWMRVDRLTGYETEVVRGVRTGGTITRNQDTEVKESGSINVAGDFDVGVDLLRCYLVATWPDGSTAREPLGTFLPSVSSRTVGGSTSTCTVDLYGRLQELADDMFETVYSLPKGAKPVEEAMTIVTEAGLSVVADSSDYALSAPWTFGDDDSGGESSGDSKLSAVNELLDIAGFSSAYTDAMGTVHLERYREPSQRPVEWSFIEGRNARFLREVEDERDASEVANIVICTYSTQEAEVRGVAVDTDPASPYSTVSLGRRKAASYSYSDMPEGTSLADMQRMADAKAAELLATSQAIVHRVTWQSVYCPVACGAVVEFSYPSQGVQGHYAIRTQDITLGNGCLIKHEGREYSR